MAEAQIIDVVVNYFLSGGGASLYVRRHTSNDSALTIVIRNTNASRVVCCELWMVGEKRFEAYATGLDVLLLLPAQKCREMFVNQLIRWESYVGAKQMTPCVLSSIVDELQRVRLGLKMKFVVPIHDYFYICPRVFCVDDKGRYCGLGDNQIKCNECLSDYGLNILEWRTKTLRLLMMADEVRCFSKDSCNRMRRIFPTLTTLTLVRHHPIEYFKPLVLQKRDVPEIVIGVVGTIDHIKGAEQVLALLRFLDNNDVNARVVVIGSFDASSYCGSRLDVTGAYRHSELPHVLKANNVGVAFFPSVCPETFGFVVQELIMLHLPIVCFDIGAQAEYVSSYEKGRVVMSMRPDVVWKALKELCDVA